MQHKRKKVTKYRGSKTHGCGSMKKRRGSGNKGGVGMAGTGKRADSKKPSIWALKKYFGNYGFVSKRRKVQTVMNIEELEQKVKNYKSKNILTEKGGKLVIDMSHVGVNKLLGTGKATYPFVITVEPASQNAISKIKEAGGEIILSKHANSAPEEEKGVE